MTKHGQPRVKKIIRQTCLAVPCREGGIFAGLAALVVFFAAATALAWGSLLWLAVAGTIASAVAVTWSAIRIAVYLVGGKIIGGATVVTNIALVLASLGIGLAAFEGFLWASERQASQQTAHVVTPPSSPPQSPHPPASKAEDERIVPFFPEAQQAKRSRTGVLTMPEEWQMRPVQVTGAARAYYWQGVLHVYDENNFRRTTPFPPRRPDVMRVMVVGDSLTYGHAIDEKWTYTALLNEVLGKSHEIEFFNLGIPGNQSEDVLAVVRQFLPVLKPDLVLYGVCLNDFMPSQTGQDYYERVYSVPLPEWVRTFFESRTRVARFVNDRYDALLRKLGFRADFYDAILHNFDDMQERFGRDVREMNREVQAAGLPPLVAIVFEQFPAVGSRGHRLSTIAQDLLRDAGVEVIDVEPYFQRYSGQSFGATRWDGHPDEEAHAIWADMIARHLLARPDVQAYRRAQ